MRRIYTTIAGMILAFSLVFATQATAEAATGWFGKDEFYSVCYQLNEACGSGGGTLKSSAETICACGGDWSRSWTDNGFNFREYQYNNSFGNHKVTIQYRQNSTGWHAWSGVWCNDSTCVID